MPNGRYHNDLIVRLLDDGRIVQLVKPFGYTDPGGVAWDVPKGAKVDGASIPRPLWSIIGGPFEGRYRKASVIHDWFCDRRSRPWKDVHRVFFHAMITSRVASVQAKVMYAGVYLAGPRWSETVVHNVRIRTRDGIAGQPGPLYKPEFGIEGLPIRHDIEKRVVTETYLPEVSQGQLEELVREVRSQDPSLAEIERIADRLAPEPRQP